MPQPTFPIYMFHFSSSPSDYFVLMLGLVLLVNWLSELLPICPSLICIVPDIVCGQIKGLFDTKQDYC
jgi:hypothetical protein